MCEDARKKGITDVPLILIDGKWAVKGGQPSDVFVQVCPSCVFFVRDPNLILLAISTRSSRGSRVPTATVVLL